MIGGVGGERKKKILHLVTNIIMFGALTVHTKQIEVHMFIGSRKGQQKSALTIF